MKHTNPDLRAITSLLWQASRQGPIRDYTKRLKPFEAPPVIALLDQVFHFR